MPVNVIDQNAPTRPATPSAAIDVSGRLAGRALAVLRILLGIILLWAFADKVFGLGFATPASKSWLMGGSPTAGYLGSLKGWLAGAFHALAGNPAVDIAFMLGLLLVGAALVLGVALRAAAVGGTALMLLMWLSALPIKTHPVLDEHIIYAAAVIALAATGAGKVWGFGRSWTATLAAAPAAVQSALA